MSRKKILRRTKIIATLGPSTDYNNNLEKILIAGANAVRLNFSHGKDNDHFSRAKQVREISKKYNKHIAILADLQGPKIRISTFKNNKVYLTAGDTFLLDSNVKTGEGDHKQVGIDYKTLANDLKPKDILLLDDGRIQLQVLHIKNMQIYTQVLTGGILSNNKGINKLGGGLSTATLTDKDKYDIITAAKIGVDYLAISFPRTSNDINYARQLAINAGSQAKIVSKIERAEAVTSDTIIDDIIRASDVVMVARGDLAIEIGESELPRIQKKIINRAHILNRAVITATQMMESMIERSIPTRAEIMDVANAVLDGTDAVMLSAETATGQYPSETVTAMGNICLGAEKISSINISNNQLKTKFQNIEEAISVTVMYTANHTHKISAVIDITETEKITLRMSRINSKLPIFTASHDTHTLNTIAIYRGVIPLLLKNQKKKTSTINTIISQLSENGYLLSGDFVIIVNNETLEYINTNNTNTNTIRIIQIK
ncbi:pyruvate kinase [Blochmannia endosymbiont of Polyrhachis (Hedomyrma) turneri]|uniref:pyruvate kinase n=1 Tax=Blochmannia endosymbiont of Polyrhachis (Hedomyrma) turneri TaxID=1505596 RepID=UPI00061A6B32|nr:pyruvate kinase [Blochmannia endosymbiont of Polyrhachis (Hedomyrma) turneri]AKC60015.1 Pyruvate kinase II [Blochmannia endosymbiont of Polyrhachis (Hedomyrma) turneri]